MGPVDLAAVGLFVAGLGLLILGAELLVRGASRLAARLGLSPLVVGLTVVALGTSAPELAIGVTSALTGEADIAIGNVVGSNIFNVLFVLGASALIVPLAASVQLIRLDVPVMIGVSLAVWVMALDGEIGRGDGMLLALGAVVYTTFSVVQSRREHADALALYERQYGTRLGKYARLARDTGYVVLGLVLLVFGSRWLVASAVAVATALGLSQLLIGLTIVAAGTSLPEVATSIVAAVRGERDIAVGNAVGSSIFNLVAVLGVSAAVAPDGLAVAPSAVNFDIPVMIAVAVACLPIFFTGHEISRWEGGLFLGYYVAYTAYLVLAATDHDALPEFSGVLVLFALPITVVTLLLTTARAAERRRRRRN
jgi:cation:H+ antiporter